VTAVRVAEILYKGAMVHGVIFSVYPLIRRKWSSAEKLGRVMLFAWIIPAWIARTMVTGHFPIFGAYESALSLCLFSGAVLFALSMTKKRDFMVFFPAFVFGMLLHGARYDKSVFALTISERSVWVHLHALFMYIAFGFVLALATSALMNFLRGEHPLRELFLWFACAYSAGLMLGSLYRFLLFGKTWSFDPMETINLVAFFAVMAIIHHLYRSEAGGRKLAVFSLAVFPIVLAAYRLILLFPPSSSYHILDISLRMHILPK